MPIHADVRPLRIGLFNVKYSPNLGDGLLSECLESELGEAAGAEVLSMDLAGRSDYGEGSRFRGTALALLDHSPTMVRHAVVETVLGRSLRKRMRPNWNRALRDLDAVVIGGGNLFGDADLNFPLKIDAAMAEVRAAGCPAAVFGVGVSDGWSPRGEALFRRALAGGSLAYASVRETRSAAIWNRRLGAAGVMEAQVVHDPGVLISRHVPAPARRDASPSPLVGLGLTHPVALRYHAGEQDLPEAGLAAWLTALVERFLGMGWRVALFTNGSPEDEVYLQQVRPALEALDPAGRVIATPRLRRPADLARFIAGLDLMLAHRLHANIAAYSYGVPHIGFAWDAKLKNFLSRVGRGAYLCTIGKDTPEDAARLAARTLAEGVEAGRRRAVLAEARDHVATLGEVLREAVEGRRAVALQRPLVS